MKRRTKFLRTLKSYRFSPTLAHSLSVTANSLEITESEFVRMVLTDAIHRMAQN